MSKFISALITVVLWCLVVAPNTSAQNETPPVTGLSDWSIFIDPGHSMRENMGLFNYSEAEKVLRVGLYLRDMLLTQTDIGAVYMTRTNDQQNVGLTERTQMANATGADFFYSIHSDAGPPSVNSTLMLWGADGQGVEKFPRGGKKMGDIMDVDLTASMRIGSRGSRADSPFYGATSRTTPYLAVNRLTNMASVLSEAGFHTNPTQQMRNLNSEWRKLEAQSAFWSILAFHNLDRPDVGIAAGYITNKENGNLINGATITIGSQSYTTDTFESLFNRHSNNPDALANGFYYIEGLDPGSSQLITVTAPGYYSSEVNTTIRNNFFTFTDIGLISRIPPTVRSTMPVANAQQVDKREPIEIMFSRKVVESSLVDQISISPEVDFTWSLSNEQTLFIQAPDMEYDTEYSITLGTAIEDLAGHFFDGNGDGNEGGTYTFTFKTGSRDTDPPVVVSVYPSSDQVASDVNTIISFTFDELIRPESIGQNAVIIEPMNGGEPAENLHIKVYHIGDQSVIQAFPVAPLRSNTSYRARLTVGIEDLLGNATTEEVTFNFVTNNLSYDYAVIDNFNSGINGWWSPQQSGSTTGIVTELTSRTINTEITNPITGSSGSLNMNYGWDPGAGNWLIRNYIPPTASQNTTRLNRNQMLEAYVFGDGSGNRFRFMLRDGNNQLEGSPWYTVDWIGWKLVRWNLSSTPAVGWVNGNGTVDGNAFTDSFQLTFTNGAATRGRFIIDDYRVVTSITEMSTHSDYLSGERPSAVELSGNFPNPFNPTTTIQFSVPETMLVDISVYDITGRFVTQLTSRDYTAGVHTVEFNASSLSSGVYLYRMTTPAGVKSGKMMLIK
ncbi:MAG: Ig-like domain-containing protein [Bacteroidetes bacterium]|nr:Ig-like domain-containing protein [Bacteroidota bacterium]